MNIHQMSVRYQPEQDRILLGVNTTDGQEIELWLTRRIGLALLPQLNRITVDHLSVPEDAKSDGFMNPAKLDVQTRKALADFRRQEVLQSADFKTPYRASFGARPLGRTPLLVTEFTLTPRTGQHVAIDFKEQLDPSGPSRSVQLALQPQLIFSLMQMLEQALQHTEWLNPAAITSHPALHSLAVGAGTAPMPEPNDENVLSGLDRPRYLN